MTSRTAKALRLLVLALVGACDGTAPGVASDVNGIWDFTAVRSNAPGGTCSDTGSILITSQGTSFSGRWERVGSCATFSYQTADSISDGTVSGHAITFSVVTIPGGGMLCSDTAAVSGAPDDVLTGRAICGSEQVTFTAVRERPLGTVAVTPASALRVMGTSTTLQVVLQSITGARVFRPVTWSSDSAMVATVSQQGLVTAAGPGTTTIRATAGGLTGSTTFTVLAPSRLSTVGAGDARTCALTAAGDPLCWGLTPGAAGGAPTPVAGGLRFVHLSMGHDFACGLATGGAAYCFGANDSGQLGNGSLSSSPMPVAVAGGMAFRAVSAGGRHACGVTAAGDAWCWGANASGQLGNGTTTSSTVPVKVSGGINFFTITSGGAHTCAIRGVDSLAFCWGDNTFGQLGDSTTTPRLAPTRLAYAGVIAPLSAGAWHTCGSALNRVAHCWGSNSSGQLGTGNMLDSHYPVPVIGGQTFLAVTAGSIHSCGIATGTGAAWCWGTNSWGQLGNGTTTSSTVPVPVSGGLSYVLLSAGLYSYSDEAINWTTAAHTCGVTTGPGGSTWCWGVNNLGQVGDGAAGFTAQRVPVKVVGQP